MKIYSGTSGFSYKGWQGSFYPEDLSKDDFLEYYSRQLPTVEINNTFYRMPKVETLESWASATPKSFRFVIKASRRITHFKRLKDPEDGIGYLFGKLDHLGRRLGPVLLQLPPNMKKNLERLEGALKVIPKAARPVFEFRHESWFDDEVTDLLREHGAALCKADWEEEEKDFPLSATADFGYFRLRRSNYDDDAMQEWIETIQEQPFEEVYVFFKHEDKGKAPQMAKRFEELFVEAGGEAISMEE